MPAYIHLGHSLEIKESIHAFFKLIKIPEIYYLKNTLINQLTIFCWKNEMLLLHTHFIK